MTIRKARVAAIALSLTVPVAAGSTVNNDKDPQAVEVKLNPRAVWQDGTPIVANDMVAWWKAMNGSDKNFDKELHSYVPLVTIAPMPEIFGVVKGLVNYGARQFEYPDYTKVGFKK